MSRTISGLSLCLVLAACGEPNYEPPISGRQPAAAPGLQVAVPPPALYERGGGPLPAAAPAAPRYGRTIYDPQQWEPMPVDDPIGRQCVERAVAQVRRDFAATPIGVEGWRFSDRYLAAYRGHPPTWAIEIGTDSSPLYRFHCIQWSDGRRTLHLIDRD